MTLWLPTRTLPDAASHSARVKVWASRHVLHLHHGVRGWYAHQNGAGVQGAKACIRVPAPFGARVAHRSYGGAYSRAARMDEGIGPVLRLPRHGWRQADLRGLPQEHSLCDEGEVHVLFDDPISSDTAAEKSQDMVEAGVTMHARECRMKWCGQGEGARAYKYDEFRRVTLIDSFGSIWVK